MPSYSFLLFLFSKKNRTPISLLNVRDIFCCDIFLLFFFFYGWDYLTYHVVEVGYILRKIKKKKKSISISFLFNLERKLFDLKSQKMKEIVRFNLTMKTKF